MLKGKGLFIFVLIILGVVLISGSVSADYYDNASYIIGDVTEDMTSFSTDINEFMNGSIGVYTFENRLDRNKQNAYNHLKDIIDLSESAPNKEIHADTVNIISSWYATIEIFQRGINNQNEQQIIGATELMSYLTSKAESVTSKLK